MAGCMLCNRDSPHISGVLALCPECLRRDDDRARGQIRRVHADSRRQFDLPESPPHNPSGITCSLCANACRIPPGEGGYCAVRRNAGGRIVGGDETAPLDWYYDPMPTNCVGIPWCAGASERGTNNLAVFYRGCTFDCLFCQNWHFRQHRRMQRELTPTELAGRADRATTCICYFGGDPTPFLQHAFAASELAREAARDRPMRICWETNGAMNPILAHRMMDFSLDSGGCVKFDLKAWSPGVHRALCGVDNQRTLSNFRMLAERIPQRPDPPPLIASTLLVPGYVDASEVAHVSAFIADCDPHIPHALLVFHPDFFLSDLPITPRAQAKECVAAAREAGLTRVRLGNVHLLGLEPEMLA